MVDNKRKIDRTICNRQVSFSVDGDVHEGTIENISNEGTLILKNTPVKLRQDTEIMITITCSDQGDRKKARVVWADERAFGAKFL